MVSSITSAFILLSFLTVALHDSSTNKAIFWLVTVFYQMYPVNAIWLIKKNRWRIHHMQNIDTNSSTYKFSKVLTYLVSALFRQFRSCFGLFDIAGQAQYTYIVSKYQMYVHSTKEARNCLFNCSGAFRLASDYVYVDVFIVIFFLLLTFVFSWSWIVHNDGILSFNWNGIVSYRQQYTNYSSQRDHGWDCSVANTLRYIVC
jgi:hypothetical protein